MSICECKYLRIEYFWHHLTQCAFPRRIHLMFTDGMSFVCFLYMWMCLHIWNACNRQLWLECTKHNTVNAQSILIGSPPHNSYRVPNDLPAMRICGFDVCSEFVWNVMLDTLMRWVSKGIWWNRIPRREQDHTKWRAIIPFDLSFIHIHTFKICIDLLCTSIRLLSHRFRHTERLMSDKSGWWQMDGRQRANKRLNIYVLRLSNGVEDFVGDNPFAVLLVNQRSTSNVK